MHSINDIAKFMEGWPWQYVNDEASEPRCSNVSGRCQDVVDPEVQLVCHWTEGGSEATLMEHICEIEITHTNIFKDAFSVKRSKE